MAAPKERFLEPMLVAGIGEAAAVWFWMKAVLPANDYMSSVELTRECNLMRDSHITRAAILVYCLQTPLGAGLGKAVCSKVLWKPTLSRRQLNIVRGQTKWLLTVLGFTQVHSQVPEPALTCLDRHQLSSHPL